MSASDGTVELTTVRGTTSSCGKISERNRSDVLPSPSLRPILAHPKQPSSAAGTCYSHSESAGNPLPYDLRVAETGGDAADPFMTVIYPNVTEARADDDQSGSGGVDGMDKMASIREGNNFGRTQIRVGGYLQDSDDNMAFLIPNDLPRSTFLYLLTASEGRDRLFKCIQCTLHILICLLKQPSFLPQGSEGSADQWARRFWKNANTIRHGRGLFKLGRWIVNAFYLQEVYERLVMKHGRAVKELSEEFTATVLRFFCIPTDLQPLRLLGWRNASTMSGSGGNTAHFINSKNLHVDEMYEYTARAERSRQHTNQGLLINKKFVTLSAAAAAAAAAGGGGSSRGDMRPGDKSAGVRRTSLLLEKAKESNDNGTAADGPPHNPFQFQQAVECKDAGGGMPPPPGPHTPRSLEFPFSPSSLCLAASESYGVGTSRSCRNQLLKPVTLLQPIGPSQGEEDLSASNENNTAPSSMASGSPSNSWMNDRRQKGEGACENSKNAKSNDHPFCSYFKSYQTLPYEPTLGDALKMPRHCETDCLGTAGRGVTSRTKACVASSPVENVGSVNCGDEMFPPGAGFDDSGISVDNSEDILPINDGDEESGDRQSIVAEMGQPANRRKRILQFSTPLILLQAVRSIATIGRRLLRDVLLLSSKRFLNLSSVEKNRASLQRHTHLLWLIVSGIDLLLNTIRLMNPGWYKYATVRENPRFRCGCKNPDANNSVLHYRDLVIQRQANIFFPNVDLDFGVPICSSPGYFEAADPGHIAPACRACGKLFVEVSSVENGGDDSAHCGDENKKDKRAASGLCGLGERESNDKDSAETSITGRAGVVFLFIPWLMRRLFNYVWLVRSHHNWSATLWLQVSYLTEFYLSLMYCFGGYETGRSDAALEQMIHPPGAFAGFLGAVIGIYRVTQSAPK
uniref:Uncharacterized protein n=1 Tax=Trypanosoma congolense (strain IL3000) TaxID=1068625 RepID=G0US27_TRYCI|nr:conserved hypothetical protein [Trypanosoma congolense IL3000]